MSVKGKRRGDQRSPETTDAQNNHYMQLPKRKQNRLAEYDYSSANTYFITVCTVNRRNLFWNNSAKITSLKEISLTPLGETVRRRIEEIPKHYPAVSVDHFVVMPNHIHLLLQIRADSDGRSMIAPTTVSRIMKQTKAAISKDAGFSVWQKSFYDHIIRGEQDYAAIWNYIEENPYRCQEDDLYLT